MARKVGQASKKNGKSGFRDPELPIKKKPFDNGKKNDDFVSIMIKISGNGNLG